MGSTQGPAVSSHPVRRLVSWDQHRDQLSVATLSDAWCHGINTGTGWAPGCTFLSRFSFASVHYQLKMASQRSERPICAVPRLLAALQGCPRNSANVCLVEHRLFPTSEAGKLAASFLHSSFLQAINVVMLWPVHVEKVPQASEHLCTAKLQTRCDMCYVCQSVCRSISSHSGMTRATDPQKFL